MIRLIKAFAYDNSYDYVKMFATRTAQDNYFNSLPHIDIEDNNYIKVNNSFNIEFDFDYLENEGVNYIIFDNGYRDIFAFIIKKEYVRENVTRLIYEVDVIQTFMTDFSVKESFVERKKCTDINEVSDFDEGLNIGEHTIVSETIAFSKDYTFFAMFNGIKNFEVTVDTNGAILNYSEIPSRNSVPSTTIDGINYPLYFLPLSSSGIPSSLADHPSLVGIVRLPKCNYTTQELKIPSLVRVYDLFGDGKDGYTTVDNLVLVAKNITSGSDSGSGGSVPKNETTDFFPYTYYVLTDGEGEPIIMKPQDLTGLTVIGKYALSHQPVERYYVQGYKGDTNGRIYNITNANQMMMPTATSQGMAYLSANGGSAFISRNMSNYGTILNGVVTAGMAIATGGMSLMLGGAQSVFSDVSKIAESDKRVNDIMMTPPSISSYGTPSTRNVFGTNNVRVLKYSVSEKVKTKIRAYIERYGNKFNNYALIDLKSYNGFIKYISPNIDSRIDNIYINKIKEILERGVYIE